MVLATRCPHCETVFRVQGAELVRSRGLVRCGHCHELFDASQSLLDPSAAAAIGFGANTGKQEAPATPNDAAVTPPVQAQGEPHEPPAPARAEPRELPATPAQPNVPHEDSTTDQQSPSTFANIVADELREPPATPAQPVVPREDSTTDQQSPSTFADIVADELREPPATPAQPVVPREDSTTEPPPSTFADIVADELREPPAMPAQPVVPREDSTTDQQPSSTFADIVADELREPTLAATPAATPAQPPLPPHEPATPTASTTPEKPVERRASETYAQPRPRTGRIDEPKHPRDVEPKLSLDGAPNRAWRTDPEPRFRMPPAAEPGIPPAGQSAHIGVPPSGPADERVPPFEVTRERRARAQRHAWLLAVGAFVALVMFVLLVVQLAWWRREAVMVYWPASQPLFASACARLGCQISPPRDIDGLQVEASDLRQIDGPHRLELRVPLHNRYGIALAYPAIELTLFDEKNEVAIRRVLWPQDYAPPGTPIAAGLPPHATQTMIMRLDSGNAVATNFRVQIFYP
jgi:predicted Zn finger-like uncharacterized protein